MLNNLKLIYNKLLAPKEKITGTCIKCGKCCKNLILTYKNRPVTDKKQFNKLIERDNFYSRFSPIHISQDNSLIYFSCNYLQNNKCRDHSNRPHICRQYPSPAMLKKGGKLLPECGYKISPEKDFLDYMN